MEKHDEGTRIEELQGNNYNEEPKMNQLRSLSGVQWRLKATGDWDFNWESTDPSNETFIMKAPNNSLNNSILIRWSSNYEVQKPRMEIL